MAYDMKAKSAVITNGRDRAAARAMYKAVGFSDEDLRKPIVGIANTWIETMPCNLNLRKLAEHVKRGVREAGGTPMELNTIAISDGDHDGHRRNEDLAGLPGGDRRLDRARRPRPHTSTR